MAKRFTESEKWKDEWFLELKKKHKLIWIYLLDNCSNGGRWKKSFKHLNFCCETNIKEEELKQVFNGRIFDFSKFFFIPKFLKFQYPKGLNSEKPAILSVRKEVLDYGLLKIIREQLGNDYLIIKDKDKDKDMDKNKDKDKVFNYSSFKETNNTEFKNKLKETYPEVNIELEFKKMGLWLQENPNKEYKNYGRFCGNWISRCARENEKGQAGKSKIRKIPPPKGGYQTGENLLE